MDSEKLVIIGTGPSGLTAAIYAARANLNPLVLEGPEPGGQLTLTTMVDNFPGFPEGIMGPELMDRMRNQAKRFGARFQQTKVESTDLGGAPFKLTTASGDIQTQTLIVSSGASARFLGLEGEKELTGKGVSTCATCDGFFYRDRIVHVVGGGDTAMEEALFLTKFAKEVTVIHRRDQLRASKPMQEKAFNNPKIKFLWDSQVTRLLSNEQGLTAIEVENLKTQERNERPTDGLFYGIGHTPNTSFLKDQVHVNDHGLILTKNNTPETNIKGVFACGDVQDDQWRQAITAAGSGCAAALLAERYLENL